MKTNIGLLIAALVLILIILVGCQTSGTTLQPTSQTPDQSMANPASENCIKQGGQLVIEERGDGGQYGICLFEDNRQCEEWALYRGDCLAGGLKITGYITPAAQYCVITGGHYSITGNNAQDNELGTCSFKDGSQCDVWDYYNGKCAMGATAIPTLTAEEWLTFTDEKAGFSIQTPTSWSEKALPDQNEGAIHGTAYTGLEGGVEVYWGTGFGGACPSGTETVQLAQVETPACHEVNSDGTEIWSQIGYEVSGGNSFSVRGYTSDAQPSSKELVLHVLSTLTFMPTVIDTTPSAPAGLTIQPLPVEVCNGQAQAMAHALDVIEVTQSEAPLDDPVNDAKGTGCQATAIGTGEQYESPDATVKKLSNMLIETGWKEDPLLAAGGPTGIGEGFRKDNQICIASAIWMADEMANCPKDQPISACNAPPALQNYTVTLNCGVESTQEEASAPSSVEMLVFDSTRGGDGYRDLFTMDSQGNNMSRLTRGTGNSFAGPWSPDGKTIVFTTFGLVESYIASINADGGGRKTLDAVDGSDESFPDWSPDGKTIAFTSRRDGNNEIYLMNADGSNPVRLTNEPGDDFAPSWAPDGNRIVFVSDRDQKPGIYDLFIMNADGSEVKHLTNDTAIDYSPDWSPDGQKIVFRSHHDGAADIYVVNMDGSGLTNLTNDPFEDWAPAWSPDGSRIAFQTNRDGNWEIYIMAADGTGLVNITNDQADDQLPYWRPVIR